MGQNEIRVRRNPDSIGLQVFAEAITLTTVLKISAQEFRHRLGKAPRVLDGGLATELQRRGHDLSGEVWSARLLRDDPDAIERVHFEYLAARADIVTSASYQASFAGFASLGIGRSEAAALLRRSVELAVAARDRFQRANPREKRHIFVAASVGPYGATLHDGSEYKGDYDLTVSQLVEFHAERLAILASSDADLLGCETIPCLDEVRALAFLLRQFPDRAAWVSLTSPDGLHTSRGELLADAGAILEPVPNVIAVGVNCVAPAIVTHAIDALRTQTSKPIIVYPNSGETWDAQGRQWRGAWSETSLADLAREWLQHGARIIGGCCRTGPKDIAALSELLRGYQGATGAR
ncbi:MAG: homocysteine S-methyltransferase [Verrucomicrobia bacterium]|nr:homocysteine S-methyltransferase [Verrucomicrobiota bacterium]